MPALSVAQLNNEVSISADEKKLQTERKLQQLRFGQVLYEYYQQKPLQSLEAIAVAQHYGTAITDKAQLQLVQGGASLQLGLTETAVQLLTDLLASSQPKEVQAQAWYWLAKTAFQQGLYSTSQKAKEFIQTNQLINAIDQEQWLELQYQSAFFNLSTNPQDWRNLPEDLTPETIWYPYLMANVGIEFFNQQDYARAAQLFVEAIDSAKTRPEESWLNQPWLAWSWWPWTEQVGRYEDSPEYRERNTLLDRLYFSVGQTFVKQNNHIAAVNAFKQIRSTSLYAEQGLLAYGWAFANEERWNEALPVWQHLRSQGKGLPALQATHALAYGFEQLTDYAKAYTMLAESLTQLEQSRTSLANMQTLRSESEFILNLARQSELPVTWPTIHQDLILDLLSGDNQQNTAKQLQHLVQLNSILEYIDKQQQNLVHLQQLLDERAASLASKAAEISIEESAQAARRYSATLTNLKRKVTDAATDPTNFATQEQRQQLSRLDISVRRLDRLGEQGHITTEQSEALRARLKRLRGAIDWQLNEQQIFQQYQHEQAIQQAEKALDEAEQRLFTLDQIANDPARLRPALDNQYQRLFELRQAYSEKTATTQALQNQLIVSLQEYLLRRIQQRDAVLLEQITATRLAILRMQDVSFSRQQQRRNEQQ